MPILFVTDRPGTDGVYTGINQVWKIQSDGSGATQLTFDAYMKSNPRWGLNGTRIFFCSDEDGVFNVYKMWADGTGMEILEASLYESCVEDASP